MGLTLVQGGSRVPLWQASKPSPALNPVTLQEPQKLMTGAGGGDGGGRGRAHPDRERAVLAANSTAAVRAAGLRRTPILLLLFEDFWVEFLKPNNKC